MNKLETIRESGVKNRPLPCVLLRWHRTARIEKEATQEQPQEGFILILLGTAFGFSTSGNLKWFDGFVHSEISQAEIVDVHFLESVSMLGSGEAEDCGLFMLKNAMARLKAAAP